MADYIPNPELGFQMAERPVKLLLHNYFKLFSSTGVLDLSRKLGLGLAYFRIPTAYFDQCRTLAHYESMPNAIAPHSFCYVPPSAAPAPFKLTIVKNKQRADQEWNISLQFAPVSAQVDRALISTCADITKIIQGALNAARGVFYQLKLHNADILETIDLVIDEPTLQLHLRDSRWPTYTHDMCIIPQLSRDEKM